MSLFGGRRGRKIGFAMNDPSSRRTPFPAWADADLSRRLLEMASAGERQEVEMKEQFPEQVRDLAKEIAAFATSNAGTILVGISDSGEIVGLADCSTQAGRAHLIQRIEGLCANVVKPMVTPAFRFGVVDDRIVLAIDVPKGVAPLYYVGNTPYLRQITAARPAEPQEVIDHVLIWHRARNPGLSAFEGLRRLYHQTRPEDQTNGRMIGFWCGLVPSREGIAVRDTLVCLESAKRERQLTGYFSRGAVLPFKTIDADYGTMREDIVPTLQGARRTWYKKFSPDNRTWVEDKIALYLGRDGTLTLAVKTTDLIPCPGLNVRWIVADVANALKILGHVRESARLPSTPYALVVELRYDEHREDSVEPVKQGEWRLCDISDETGQLGPIVNSDPKTLGPYVVAGANSFESILASVFKDLYAAGERRPPDEMTFELN